MGLLSKKERTHLLSITSLKKFVDDEEKKYITKVKEWRAQIPSNSDLAEPEMLAGSLTNYLKMYDEKLSSKMWDLWRKDMQTTDKYYIMIGKYFVDRESELSSDQ